MITFQVTGKVGNDATIAQSKTNKIINFSLCHKEVQKIKGEQKEVIQWFAVTKFEPLESQLKLSQYLKKGVSVSVKGSIAPAHWIDANGQVKNKIVVTASDIELL